ncbi:MAG: class I SAM-dependent methyltransferase [Truepera sp.]|nr:class I SAM-dependent methyltransferase [Truepera sp.]
MASYRIRLWDETVLPAGTEPPRATLVLTQSEALGRMLELPLDLSVAEAYLHGDFNIEGDPEAVFEVLEVLEPRLSLLDWAQLAREAAILRRHAGTRAQLPAAHLRGPKHSKARDRQAVQHHYDLSNRFYELWLGKRMVYSCAYFPSGHETLDEAQEAKLELICRKLRLKPGERLLDIGCGWGGLVIYAAERYGVKVKGITISQRQLEEAQRRVHLAGLGREVALELCDYRDLTGEFDKIASVGMAEHVGGEKLPVYFQVAWQRLRPGGLMLNHAISAGPRSPKALSRVISGELNQRYVFPDTEIVPLWQSLKAAEEAGFEVCDVEDWRQHYARTLRCWRRQLEANWEAAARETGLEQARLRRFFMSAAAYQFAFAHLAVHQALLAKPDAYGRVAVPLSREDLYR